MKHVGNELRRIIEEKRLVKRQLAARLGMSASYFGQQLNKASLDAAFLERVCKVVGISPGYMFDDWPTTKYTIGDISQSPFIGDANVTIGADSKMLEKLLEEKERTIQILMKERENKD